MKILNPKQVRAADAYTIEHEPVHSIDLMERAAWTFVEWFAKHYDDTEVPIYIFCGTGDNGGDGLAAARLLHQRFYDVTVYLCKTGEALAAECQTNLDRLPGRNAVRVLELSKTGTKEKNTFPNIPQESVVIDALLGSGLNRPLEGYWEKLIEYLNNQDLEIVSIDIPSGLFMDKHTEGIHVKATRTLSFELPKLAFFFAENGDSVGEWEVRSIGLDKGYIEKTKTPYHYIEEKMVKAIATKRQKYDHKGNFGHALLMLGSYGKIGAAVLATKACLRAGAGLVTVHVPNCGYEIMQMSVPEAMVSVDPHEYFVTRVVDTKSYKSVGAGCGLGKDMYTVRALEALLRNAPGPVVLDADALNIISENNRLLKLLPPESILTPHPKEFERLFGATENDFERNDLQRKKSQELGIHIILKGANTAVTCPDGSCYFNSTGNPGMATAGSGDVLTGLLTGLLAQDYTPFEASILGVYVHGLSGDIAAEVLGHEALLATDIVDNIGKAFLAVKK